MNMPVEQAKAFVAKVKEDPELAKKLKDAQAAYTGDKDAAFATIVLPIAAAAGFNFTVEDFKAAFDKGEGEVSEDELDAVAGGAWYEILYGLVTSVQKEVYCNWQGMPW